MTGQELLEILGNSNESKSIPFNYFYDGKNPVDLFSIPFDTVDDIMSIPRAYRYKGMTVTVLSGSTLNESGKPIPEEYWLVGGIKDENWQKKPYLTINDVSGATQGPQGPQGADGAQGPQGADGADGAQGPQGANGVDGVDGVQGPQGADGADGAQGPQGAEGADGAQGPQGADGADGAQGPQGADGADGAQGPQGADGAQGPQGADGADGAQGPQGADGVDGAQGPQGADGVDGADGAQGPQGADGADGAQGPQGSDGADGAQGPQGADGADGAQGPQGADGADGAQGPQGDDGADGAQGPQGADGAQGPQGADGTSVRILGSYSSIEELENEHPTGNIGDGYLINGDLWIWNGTSWENVGNIKGPQGNQGPQGAEGAQGPQGADGADGAQGPQGADGADGAQGPQGADGAQGPQGADGVDGADGAQGPQGADGADGAQGPQGADGADGAQGPQGADGAQGPQGADGAQGPQGADGVDGADGAQGPQGADGADGAQGPQGADGADGAQGPQGADGAQGPQGADGAQGPQGADGADGTQGPQGADGAQGPQGADGAGVTTSDIIVAGGPLSDDVQDNWPTDAGWTDLQGNKVIPSGSTLDEILSKLFSRETWYMPSITYGWNSTITKAPTVNISTAQTGNIGNTTLEVGTIVYFNGATANTSDSTYKVESSGCENGYKKFENGTHIDGNYSKTYTCVKTGDYNLEANAYGFKSDTGGTSTSYIDTPSANSNISASSNPMYVNDGQNYVNVYQTGRTYNPVDSEDFESFVLFAASNMNNYSQDYSVDVNYLQYEGESVVASGTKKSSTITGYRKYFYGLLDTEVPANMINSNVVRGLTGSTAAANGNQWNLEIVAGKAQVIIAVPKSQFNSMEVFQVSINDNIQNVPRANWKEVSVAGANGYKPVTYVVWSYSTASGSFPANDMYKITFKNV